MNLHSDSHAKMVIIKLQNGYINFPKLKYKNKY